MEKAVLLLSLLCLICQLAGGTTIETQAEPSVPWSTLHSYPAQVRVPYPDGATVAKLTVTALDGTETCFEVASPTRVIEWRPFGDAAAPETDDLYTLSLQFYADNQAVGEPLVSRIAVLRDNFVGASVRIEDSKAWRKTKERSVVVPYATAWVADKSAPVTLTASQDGETETDSAEVSAGWLGVKPGKDGDWTAGAYTLALAYAGDESPSFSAGLNYGITGLLMIVK